MVVLLSLIVTRDTHVLAVPVQSAEDVHSSSQLGIKPSLHCVEPFGRWIQSSQSAGGQTWAHVAHPPAALHW